MKVKKQIDRWLKDTMILVSREVRAKLKVKAILQGLTLKDYLKKIAYEK
jgi:hypothetical protein